MTPKSPRAPKPSPEAKANPRGGGFGARKGKKKSPVSYVDRAKAARTLETVRKVPSKVFPQWLRTVLMVTLWLGMTPIYVSVIAPYVAYLSATVMSVGLAIFSGLAPHLWPSKTSPWRTVFWALVVSLLVGMTVVTTGGGRYSVVLATVVGFLIVIARANMNGRRLVSLFKTWRALR